MTSTTETFDFGFGHVPAHRHINPDRSIGGWVAETATVEPTVYIEHSACVYNCARVLGEVTIHVHARVYGYARVHGYSTLFGNIQVYDHADVSDSNLHDNVEIFGKAKVIDCKIYDDVMVYGYSEISELVVHGAVHIRDNIWSWGSTPRPSAEDQQKLLAMIADKVAKKPNSLDMGSWHSDCGTASCLAGWAQILAGRPRSRDNAYRDGVELIPMAAHLFYAYDDEVKVFLSQFRK